MERITIGQIVNVVGLKGEVKVYNYSDYKERYEELKHIYVKEKRELNEYLIEKVRYQKDMVILKLKGVDDRNQAEALRQKNLVILEEDLRDLPEDTFYIKDLIGIKAIDKKTGKEFGVVKDVLTGTAQEVYQITLNTGKEALIPNVKEFVKEVNLEEGFVAFDLIPGFIDDDFVAVTKEEE